MMNARVQKKERDMAYYFVRATGHNLEELRARLDSGEIGQMQPFGGEMAACLNKARMDEAGWVVWEENCYCNPPLKQERAAVLDTYFSDLTTQVVQKGEGWARIEHLPGLWEHLNV
jgi:hypothetical protein